METDDVHQALKEVENSLRDFVAYALRKRYGTNWIEKCGASPQRIAKWQERKAAEVKRQPTGTVEQRLLYYADFYDLGTLLKQHWSDRAVGFSDALGKWKTVETFLDELEKLRDPHAHQRELLPHQKHLILGLSGEIRNRLIRYRSKMETSEDYYPRLESVRDNFGNVWVPGNSANITGDRLRVGGTLELVVSATDPLEETLSYRIRRVYGSDPIQWQENNVLRLDVTAEDVRRDFKVIVYMRSPRPYHARGTWDDDVTFLYEVLPPMGNG